MGSKAMIIGLDCAEPSLVLERWRDQLPTLAGLMQRGRYGRLCSVVPPITVPAWSCMMASRTPGDLGIYGFRNRADHSYDNLVVADGSAVHAPRLWDVSAAPAERRARQLLSDALARERLHVSAAARARGRAGRRRVPVRLHQ